MTPSGCTRNFMSSSYKKRGEKEKKGHAHSKTGKKNLKYSHYCNRMGHNFKQLFMLLYKDEATF